jgi:hypothetical protein
MVLNTRDKSSRAPTSDKATAYKCGQMVPDTKDSGRTELLMEEASFSILMEIFTRVSFIFI